MAVTKMSQGAGHDGGAGFFLDGAGNDRYSVTELSHGAANDLGFGFAVDLAGNDTYGTSAGDDGDQGRFGQSLIDSDYPAAGPKQDALSLGAFFDLGGTDQYLIAPQGVTNNTTWKLPNQGGAPPTHLGLGHDQP